MPGDHATAKERERVVLLFGGRRHLCYFGRSFTASLVELRLLFLSREGGASFTFVYRFSEAKRFRISVNATQRPGGQNELAPLPPAARNNNTLNVMDASALENARRALDEVNAIKDARRQLIGAETTGAKLVAAEAAPQPEPEPEP
jgi:hypothetical protein